MLGRLFGKKTPKGEMVIVQLNARLQPLDRGAFFEDPLDTVLKKQRRGEVSGGGTLLTDDGEIESCDIELTLPDTTPEALQSVVSALHDLGAPKGSKLRVAQSGSDIDFGRTEGLAVYLNGTDLPDETYETCDADFVHSEFDRLLDGEGRVLSSWQGPTETAFYIYGDGFERMRERLADFLATYPLCQKCRVVQVA